MEDSVTTKHEQTIVMYINTEVSQKHKNKWKNQARAE